MPHADSDDLDLPAHLKDVLSDAEFDKRLEAELEAARARNRAAPNPLANLTPEDIRRSRACPLPEIIGIAPGQKPRVMASGLKPEQRTPLSDAEFERLLDIEATAARARIRAAPNPLAGLTREDIRRSEACALPELIGITPGQKPRGTQRG